MARGPLFGKPITRHPSLNSRCVAGKFLGAGVAAVKIRSGACGIGLALELRGKHLRVIFGPVADQSRRLVVPLVAGVRRDAVDHDEMECGRVYAALHELNGVAMTDPRPQLARVLRPRAERTYPQ